MNPEVTLNLRRAVTGFVVIVILFGLLSSRPFLVVPAGHRAVVFNIFTGVEQRVRGEGINLLIPAVQFPQLYDVRTRSYTMSATAEDQVDMDSNPLVALTKDGQPVTIDLTVLYHVNEQELPQLFQQIGLQDAYLEKIIRPELRTLVRMAVSQYGVTDLYSQNRESLETDVAKRVETAFAACHLTLEDIKLRNITFSASFQEAIEKKQVAEQQVKRMEYILKQASKDREKAVVEAQGEADSLKLVAESVTRNPSLIEYEWVNKLNPKAKTVLVDSQTIVSLGDVLGGK